MSCYTHLSIEDRENILRYLSQGKSLREIAKLMGRSASTISRELRRNQQETHYSPSCAQKRYRERKRHSGPKPLLEKRDALYWTVRWCLVHMWWSPEQIANRLDMEGSAKISHHTIYRALARGSFGPTARFHLRRGHGTGAKKGSGKGVDRSRYRSIHERPVEANERSEPGHLEGDLVMLQGQTSVLITVIDRHTRMLYTALSPGKDAHSVRDAMKQLLLRIPADKRKTLTLDRGSEFADLPAVEENLGLRLYFCDPASPRQRATNENVNGLLRQFFPKRSITFSPQLQLASFTALLNLRPRKCLAWLSPFELHSHSLLHFS